MAAEDGILFLPLCILTGRYQIHTGLQDGVLESCTQPGLPLHLPTLADKLKETGYVTHMVGRF